MPQVRGIVTVNLLPSGSGESVVDLCDELLLLLEAAASEIGVVVDKTFEHVLDDESVVDDDDEIEAEERGDWLPGGSRDGERAVVTQATQEAILLADAFAIGESARG